MRELVIMQCTNPNETRIYIVNNTAYLASLRDDMIAWGEYQFQRAPNYIKIDGLLDQREIEKIKEHFESARDKVQILHSISTAPIQYPSQYHVQAGIIELLDLLKNKLGYDEQVIKTIINHVDQGLCYGLSFLFLYTSGNTGESQNDSQERHALITDFAHIHDVQNQNRFA